MNRLPGYGFIFLSMTAMILLGMACAGVPREAPELSMELGNRIALVEESHITLLHHFMDERRKDIDEFMREKWTPVFAEEYFRQPGIIRVWDEVVASDDPQDRFKLLTLVGPALQERILEERLNLIEPVDELEKELERRLRDEYWQMKAINGSLTGLLASSADLSESRSELMAVGGLDPTGILMTLDYAEDAVERLVEGEGSISDRFETFKSDLERLHDLNRD